MSTSPEAHSTFEELRAQTSVWKGFPGRWWVAGGWAIDLAIGSVTRAHDDIDFAVLRRDANAVRAQLKNWDVRIAMNGTLREWKSGPLAPSEYQIWAREESEPKPTDVKAFAADPTFFEVLIEEHDDDRWVYRRSALVGRPIEEFSRARFGMSFVAPDVQLLFKSKPHPSYDAKNDEDFRRCLPHLDASERSWLREALTLASPGHRWLGHLS